MKKGIFITFEGAEGSGKSTNIRFVAAYFRKRGKSVLLVREPGSTTVSEAIRKVLLDNRNKEMSKETELLLYLAARAELVKERILPALQKGKVVISDRYEDSTFAYQGYGEGISLETITQFSRFVRGNLKPDLTFVLDVDPQIGFRRGGRHDRVEKKPDSFHTRVRRGFLTLAKKEKKRIVVLKTHQPIEVIQMQILNHLKKLSF